MSKSRRFDGKPETEADTRFFNLLESGYTGWIDRDGNAVTTYTAPSTGKEMKLPPHGFSCKCSECR